MASKDPFYLKVDESTVVATPSTVKQLAAEIEKAPESASVFHLSDGRNDFFEWISQSVKDKKTAAAVRKVKCASKPEATKKKLLKALRG